MLYRNVRLFNPSRFYSDDAQAREISYIYQNSLLCIAILLTSTIIFALSAYFTDITGRSVVYITLTLKVLVTTIDALEHFQTG